jgi:hypothetical protein
MKNATLSIQNDAGEYVPIGAVTDARWNVDNRSRDVLGKTTIGGEYIIDGGDRRRVKRWERVLFCQVIARPSRGWRRHVRRMKQGSRK